MCTFEQLRNIIDELDASIGGITDDRLIVLKTTIDEIGIDLEKAEPVRLIEVSYSLLRGARTDSGRARAAEMVHDLLEQWLDLKSRQTPSEQAA